MQRRNPHPIGTLLFLLIILVIIGWFFTMISPPFKSWVQQNMTFLYVTFALFVLIMSVLRYFFHKKQGSFGKFICIALAIISSGYIAYIFLGPIVVAFINWIKQYVSVIISVTIGVLVIALAVVISINYRKKKSKPIDAIDTSTIMSTRLSPSEKAGWVYIAHSAALKEHLFKVGITKEDVTNRMIQLSGPTGVPSAYVAPDSWFVSDCAAAESLIHEELKQYRFNQSKEFFLAPYQTIFNVAKRICDEMNNQTNVS